MTVEERWKRIESLCIHAPGRLCPTQVLELIFTVKTLEDHTFRVSGCELGVNISTNSHRLSIFK